MSDYRYRISRRGLLGGVAGAAATASLLGNLPPSVVEAAQNTKARLDSIEHVVILMQENRSFDHYYGSIARRARLRRSQRCCSIRDWPGRLPPAGSDARRRRLPAALPRRHPQGRRPGPGRPRPRLEQHPRAVERRRVEHAGPPPRGELTMGYFDRRRHPVPARARPSVHALRQLLLLGPGTDDAEPAVPLDRHHRPGRRRTAVRRRQPGRLSARLHLDHLSERLQTAGVSWQVYANDEVGDGGGPTASSATTATIPLWLFQAYHDALASTDPKSTSSPSAPACARSGSRIRSGHRTPSTCWRSSSPTARPSSCRRCPGSSRRTATASTRPRARSTAPRTCTTMLSALWANPGLWAVDGRLHQLTTRTTASSTTCATDAPPGTADEFLPATSRLPRSPPPSARSCRSASGRACR